MNTNTINGIFKYCIIIGLAVIPFIPLYVANSLFFPFITGKAFVFRIIVEIIFSLWLILIFREKGTNVYATDKSVAPRINFITIFVTLFTIIVLIADLFGTNPLRSIWSNSERMEGWITIVHLWAYFMVLSSIFGSGVEIKKNWFKFLNVTIIAATITAIYGLFQYFGWAAIHQGSSRVDASLGNSAYMAVYMLIHAFLVAYMAFSNRSKPYLLWTYSFLFVFFSFIMFQTGTRGTILGWIAGIIVACFIYSVWGRKEHGQSNISRIISGSTILLLIIIGSVFYLNRDSKLIQKSEVLSRLASISISDTKTQARGYIWPMALKGSFENPKTSIIGWGQENFNYLFNKNYNPKMWKHEQWFDRAHNVFLDWLVATGLLGLAFYLSLYIISLVYIIKSNLDLGQKSILIALLVAYGIHNIFVFDNQTSYVMFMIFLAYIHSMGDNKLPSWLKNNGKPVSEDYITVVNYIFVPIISVLFIVGFYFINVRNIQANTRLIEALRDCSGGNITSTKSFEKALSLNQTTVNQETREQLISCSINVISSNKVASQLKNDFYNLTKKEIDKQIISTPKDARIYVLAGSFFNSIGDWNTALPYIENARKFSPEKQSVAFDLAVNYINTGKSKEALDIIKSAYESAPDYPEAQSFYVAALIDNNQESKARELFPNNPDLFTHQRVIGIYIKNKQYDKVISVYKELLAKDPKDIQTRSYLVAAYIKNNQNYLAIQELKKIKEITLDTELKKQVDSAIKQIEEGKSIF